MLSASFGHYFGESNVQIMPGSGGLNTDSIPFRFLSLLLSGRLVKRHGDPTSTSYL